ncbi:CPBP family intramembrane glutamic endopeptidase [Microbacterium sp. MPKO10]|uniref:CPBP family intramembrane glutamic endopeptidase n=1 Tax=Microbacterium sp. MPKO10 TaxID=2989818 RepID=UPI0022368655|nr:CPBP family intramembrane glutamic endopeptidase [Microbacterium sp. MPKO10]MCW4459911.1 CPBP family intramembrane metalloprotease [Microbacterium sp. MPKO10]
MNNLNSASAVTSERHEKHSGGRRRGRGMRLLWQLLVVLAAVVLARLISAAVGGNPWLTFGIGLATGVLAIAVYAWVVRRTEHRAPAEVSLKSAAPSVAWSTGAGIALFGAVIGLIALGGFYAINGLGSPANALGLLGFMAGAAVSEELIFRGILFRIVEEWTGTWIALVLVGLLFGLVHLLNANATLVGALAIAIEAGGMLTAAYIATRKLWVPIGLHFGWNLAASAIFSTELSGSGAPTGLLDATTAGPALLTGGDFGPEASVYAVALGMLATAGFMWMAYRRGYVVPVRRSDRAHMIETRPW